ncbi:MAG: electron transfer flavoprotein subunit alpha/FixB family protein, partial [Spirochaetaceae bacterium]
GDGTDARADARADAGTDGAAHRSRGRVVPSQLDESASPGSAEPPPEEANLDECDVIVSVGLGIGSKENVDRLARPLVRALEKAWGVTVGLGCSRAAMEAGYLPYSAQVGQTGKTVKPCVYIALGISGAVQHRVGMEKAGRILSINSDDEAPLLSHSDYVIRASCQEAVPVLIRLLEEGA